METWPTDSRKYIHTAPHRAGRPSAKEREWKPDYLLLQPGSIGALTLVESNGQLEWESVTNNDSEATRLQIKESVTIFPPTCSPTLIMPRVSTQKRAEEGANFLRTYLPDVDIAAEIIREEVSIDARATRQLETFDPYVGNLLEPVISYDHSMKPTTFLAFPMGELKRELNLSPFILSGQDGIVFTPSPTPMRTFDTPIQQIVASNSLHGIFESVGSYLGVRTFGTTSIMQLRPQDSANQVHLTDLKTFTSADVGGRAIVDMKLFSSAPELIVVNARGGLYRCDLFSGHGLLGFAAEADTAGDPFWRVALERGNTGCFLASSKRLKHIDFRINKPTDIFSTIWQQELLTAIEDEQSDNITRLCSTHQILWIDKRMSGKPLLGYKHGRQFDRSLRTSTLQLRSSLSLLSSSKNNLITVYDVSRSEGNLLHLQMPPYCLYLDNTFGPSQPGRALWQPSGRDVAPCLLRLSDRGSVYRFDLFSPYGNGKTMDVEWTPEIKALDLHARSLRPATGSFSAREYSEADFQPLYQKLFRKPEEVEDAEEAHAEAVYELIEHISSFWQNSDTPLDHTLTMHDIAFRAGEEPAHASRTDFLTESIIDSTRGYRALVQGRLPVETLKKEAPWHTNIAPILGRFDPGFDEDPQRLSETLQRFDLALDPRRPSQSLQREAKARQQLALDLSLSKDVFSPRPFLEAPDVGAALETMTEALSLSGESPLMAFGYLQPIRKNTDHYSESKQAGALISIGTQSILKDWEIGVDPSKISYRDKYKSGAPPASRAESDPHKRMGKMQSMPSQRPPAIASSIPTLPVIPKFNKALPTGNSQPSNFPPHIPELASQRVSRDLPAHSQEYMTSTQILPGPFGGRPLAGKKKAPKKRLGARSWTASQRSDGAPWMEKGTTSFHDSELTSNPLYDPAAFNEALRRNKAVVCALSASYISTFAGYPLDSLKSRLQTTKTPITIPGLATLVYREEGIAGFYRGLWIPLMTISFVRAASFTIYNRTKEHFRNHNYLCRDNIIDVSLTGGISGAMSGALISFGSAPFELVKVRRQLEYTIAASRGVTLVKPPGTAEAVREIFRANGIAGLYTGFRLHFLRDTSGTALYFLEYDGMRHLLGRQRSGEQGPTPSWLPIHSSLVPFVCGSVSGVTSWALIYPLDVVKTKVQQRSLAGDRYRGVWETLHRLIRGPDPNAPKPLVVGIARIYRGLGVSAIRSITTHGLLWTFFDLVANYIDNLPHISGEG
ncbi:hypothetical protein BD779DRAFT_1436750 [Infundibulicybe gibba]|nr:hypothetical protein BD779DRAFT_1436750 [Infundibulicybe gibba]